MLNIKRVAYIRRSVIDEMLAESIRMAPLETGGVLMGYWATPQREVVIEHLIGPGPAGKHCCARFESDSEWQKIQISKIYAASGRYQTYLGDWHSHPGGFPALSNLDRQTLKRISSHGKARAPYPIMAVIAGKLKWFLSVWCLEMQRGRIVKRQVIRKYEIVIVDDSKF
jgi:integrative and conjugative element protein (TIGR02256 family)